MVWIKVCKVSLGHFTAFSDGRPTDKTLEKKASKETSPPSQAHAFIEIYKCKVCFDGKTICEESHLDNIKTEVVSTGVLTTIIYTAANMADKDQVVHAFESLKTVDEIQSYLSTIAKDIPKYNLFKNNCICFVQNVCKFLGEELPDNKLQDLQRFMEKLSTKTGWVKLASRWFLMIGCPVLICYWAKGRFS